MRHLTEEEQKVIINRYLPKMMDVIVYIDFHKIHKAMVALDWKWVIVEGVVVEARIPQEHELKAEALRLMKNAVIFGYQQGEEITTGSGGFMIVFDPKDEWLKVSFVLEEWETEVHDPDASGVPQSGMVHMPTV